MTNEFTSAPPPQALIMDTVFGFFRARTLQAFAELGVADAIAARGYELTPVGEALRADVPGSMHGFAASVLGGGHYRGWGALADAARTGECAFDKVHGEDIWSYFTKTNPAEGRLFNQAMAGSSAMIVQSVLAHYDFPEHGLFVDVAGGNGMMLSAILRARPEARGIVMDLPFTAPAATANLVAQGVADRCEFVAGDFFQAVPAGGDLYTMKWILHDWSDDRAGAILRNLHRAMPAHAKLLLVEAVVPEGDDAQFGRMMDLNMMVMCGGKERTEPEWRQLLNANGFAASRVIPMPGPVSLVEAVKQQ